MTLREYEIQAADIVSRSHALWRSVNNSILAFIHKAIKNHRSKAWFVQQFRDIYGPPNEPGPVCWVNWKVAADAIENGDDLSCL